MSTRSQSAVKAETEARLRFEMLLADVCAQFVNVVASDVDSKIQNAQRAICESLRIDHSSVWQVSEDNPDLLVMTHVYRDPNLKPLPSRPTVKEYFPWSYNKILNKEIVWVPNTATLPPEAAKDKESWEQYGIHSSLVFPLSVGGDSVIGVLAFDGEKERNWPEPLQRRLQILAHVLAQALERKHAEQKVRESENRFRLIADTAPVLIWTSGTDKLCTYFNKPWLDFTGRSMDKELGNGWAEGVHPEDLQRCLDTYSQSFNQREKFSMEYRLRRHDGKFRWILDIGVPRFNEDRSFAGYIGIGVDVTDRKTTEEALHVSEKRFRLAQQAARIGTFEWNIQTGVNTWTPELEAMYGLPPGGFEGTQKAFENLVHPDDLAGVIELAGGSLKTGQPANGEWRVVWRDGSVHWIAGRWQVFMDASGEPSRVVGVNIDVSERKQAEERLREYEKAVEGAEDMIGVIDREYRFLLANRQYLKMRNLTREQVVGHFVPEVLNREIFETVIKPKLDECFQGKVVRYEMKVSYPTVGERDLLLSYFPIEDVNGVDRAACILHDITDRKRAEEALSGMTRKLIEAQEQERSRIGRELHDDINQRLALLALELEQLQNDPYDVQNHLQELRKQTSEISSNVHALSHDLHSSKLEYLGVVAGIKSWCKEFAERQKAEIDFRSSVQSVLPLEVGRTLFRVLQEALHNSIKHSGVKHVEVHLLEDCGEIHLVVGDLGKGFDPEAALQGIGLGLISMSERVRLVNGTIAIDSKPMGGTTIHVRVPLEAEHVPKRAAG